MKHVGSRTAATGIFAAGALTTAACSSSASSGGSPGGQGGEGSKGAILIGVPVPLSGEYASAGTDILHGAQLAAKDINAKGGVDGKKIQIVSQGEAGQAPTGSHGARKRGSP